MLKTTTKSGVHSFKFWTYIVLSLLNAMPLITGHDSIIGILSLSHRSVICVFLWLSTLEAGVETNSLPESHYTRGDLATITAGGQRFGLVWFIGV